MPGTVAQLNLQVTEVHFWPGEEYSKIRAHESPLLAQGGGSIISTIQYYSYVPCEDQNPRGEEALMSLASECRHQTQSGQQLTGLRIVEISALDWPSTRSGLRWMEAQNLIVTVCSLWSLETEIRPAIQIGVQESGAP